MLGRPQHVEPLSRSLHATTDRGRLLWLCSEADEDVIEACRTHGQVITLPRRVAGDYAHKINVGVLNSSELLIFMGACDIRFRSGWLEACEARLSDEVRVVGTNDLANPRTRKGHSTHSLLTRDYAQLGLIDGSPGVLHEGYEHEYCDDEFVGTARKRGAYAHAHDAYVEHLHPMAGKGEWDDSYRQQKQRMAASRAEYVRRRRLWM